MNTEFPFGAGPSVVPVDLLEALAAEVKEDPKTAKPPGAPPHSNGHAPNGKYDSRLMVDKWLSDRSATFRVKAKPDNKGRTVYVLKECPFDAGHGDPDSCVMQDGEGAMSAQCFHNSCEGRGWQQFKEKIGKPGREHYDPPLPDAPFVKRGSAKTPSASTSAKNKTSAEAPQGEIVVNDRQLPEITEEALVAIRAANDPPRLFQRAGCLTRICVDPRNNAPGLSIMGKDAVRGHLARIARWVVLAKEERINVSPPMDVVKDLDSLPKWDGVPPIHAVIETPVFVGDGRLVSTPGYDAGSGLWYHPAPGLEIPAVPERPTKAEVMSARELLLTELMGDFPFNDGPGADGGVDGAASRACALAAVLLPFVRGLIDGPTPFHLFDAPVEGTGKTLLVSSVSIIAVGRAIEGMAEATSDEEWRKRITAALVEGPTFVFLDNLNRILDSGALASALTSTTWKDRILGFTKTIAVPNDAVWMGSGNNTKLSRELIRRSIWCRLDSRTDTPWLRTGFRHKHLIRWAKKNRGRLVAAVLTLCRAWIAAGKPEGEETLGMFEGWAGTIGGILGVAEVPGLLTNAKAFRAAAADKSSEWRDFVKVWWAKHADGKVGVDVLFQLAVVEKLLDSVLGDKGERSQRTRLGLALSKMRDRVFGAYRLTWQQEDDSGRQTYQLREEPKDVKTETADAATGQEPDDFEMES